MFDGRRVSQGNNSFVYTAYCVENNKFYFLVLVVNEA